MDSLSNMLIPPHGSSQLLPQLLLPELLPLERKRAASLQKIELTSRTLGDLIMLGMGGFTPLSGFMPYADWKRVCQEMKLASGLFWPIPITLSVSKEEASRLKVGQEVLLVSNKKPMGILKITECYRIDKGFECESVFKTKDSKHPGVLGVLKQGDVNVAGSVKVLSLGTYPKVYPDIFLLPAQTRQLFLQKHWETIVAFQTRNPMHRAHERLVKIALEHCDGLFIHSLLGQVKAGDLPGDVCVRAIQTLVANYFSEEQVVQGGYPLDMRYAGPREALLHALFRQNYGCTHFIVGRDHAGVGQYYKPYEAQQIFDEIPQDALQIKPIKMDEVVWCYSCHDLVTRKTCFHNKTQHLVLSGTELRERLEKGAPIPTEFSRPEVIEVLRTYYTGHSF